MFKLFHSMNMTPRGAARCAFTQHFLISIMLIVIFLLLPSLIVAQGTAVITIDNTDQLTLMHTLTGHTLPINDLVFAPDGAALISASDDITARTWDMVTGEGIWTLNGQLIQVRSVDISPDGEKILTTGFNSYAFQWDVRSKTRADEVQQLAAFNDGEYAPDGETFALSIGDGTVRIYDAETNEELQVLQASALRIPRISYSPDGTQIAAGTGFPDNQVLVWDAASGELLYDFDFFDDTILSLDYRADGLQLAAAAANGEIVVIDTVGLAPIYIIEENIGGVFDVAYNPQNELAAAVDFGGGIKLWNSENGEALAHLLPEEPFTAVAFSKDGALLAAAGENATVFVWHIGE
jgi:WD40 repeat protein